MDAVDAHQVCTQGQAPLPDLRVVTRRGKGGELECLCAVSTFLTGTEIVSSARPACPGRPNSCRLNIRKSLRGIRWGGRGSVQATSTIYHFSWGSQRGGGGGRPYFRGFYKLFVKFAPLPIACSRAIFRLGLERRRWCRVLGLLLLPPGVSALPGAPRRTMQPTSFGARRTSVH